MICQIKKKVGIFFYLNSILNKIEAKFNLKDFIEEKNQKESNNKYKNLIKLRKSLGVVFNEQAVFKMIFDFSSEISSILNDKDKIQMHESCFDYLRKEINDDIYL